ncbi:MAG: hypothetical protein AAF660_06230 [Pseudomonadota bacterium]
MQGLIKLLVVAALAYGAYFFYDDVFGSGTRALQGVWQSNKAESLAEAERSGISQGRRALLARIYGKVRYEIDADTWSATMDGQTLAGTFEVKSREDDCYVIHSVTDNDIDLGDSQVCLRDGRMLVFSEQTDSYEVFDRL